MKPNLLRLPSPLQREFWTQLWRTPDPSLVDAGQRGEWFVASIRLLIVVLLLFPPLRIYFDSPSEDRGRVVLWVAVAALAEALVVYSAVRRSWGRGWIGFFSGFVDITLVTMTLGVHVRLGRPELATSDLVVFPLYLLAIGATSLRYDWRICVVTGLGAIAQYGALLAWVDLSLIDGAGRTIDDSAQLGRFLLVALATGLATAIVVRTGELRHLSTRDRLTQLANRGFFDESLRNIGALASRSGDPVAVAMIDVDHFKKFNDTWGHLAGDDCLRTVARILDESFRTTDLVARYGGEEFSGLFPGMDPENAVLRLDRLRTTIESTKIPLPGKGGESTGVTVSIGLAIWPFDGDDLAAVLAVADERLYEAKRNGRNRVVSGNAEGREKTGEE